MHPRQSPTTHTEQLGDEASVYDWARAQVHALNPTAACVWRLCDGTTSRAAIAAALRRELDLPEAEAVVDLTLAHLTRLHLLERPVEARVEGGAPSRRWLLAQGVAAALLPAIYSVVAPTPLEAQSPGPGAPTLTGIEPDNGNPRSTVKVELRGTNFVDGGRTIVNVSGSGVTAADVVVISATSLTATFVVEAGAVEGPRTVTVTTAGGTSSGQTFKVSLPTSAPGGPALTSLAPNQGVRGSTVAVTLTGSEFVVGATTVAIAGGGVGIHSVVVTSATSLTAAFVIEAGAVEGPRTVTVTTAGGTSSGQSFRVNLSTSAPGAPTLTSLAPNQGVRGSTVGVTLTGTDFVAGATVAVGGGGVTVNTVTVASATSLTANFVLDAAAAAGPRSVTVVTANGTSGAQSFTVTLSQSAPMLASVTPNLGLRGSTVAVTLTGNNFRVGATTVTVAGGGVTVTGVAVSGATSLTANFVLDPAAAEGPRPVTVTTADGTSGAQTFTVTVPLPPGAPTLTGVVPTQGVRGTTVAMTLTGTNFTVGATTVAVGGSGVTVTNVAVSSATSLTANFVLDPAAAVGPRTVTVTTAIGTSGPRIFTIGLGVPTLASITPNQGIQGTTVAVTLTGTNFVLGATVAVAGGGITVANVAVSSDTSLTANFVLDPAATGPRSVTVTTPAGTSGAQTFTINLPPGPGTPTLAGVAPNQGLRGTTVAVTMTGTGFVVGATTVNVGGGMTVNSVVVANATSLTANFVLDPAAAVGPRIVTVTTASGTSAPQAFTVTSPPPTLTSISPDQAIRGETVAVTLTGTNFTAGGTTVAVAGGGITVTNVVVVSATSLTASFLLDLAANGPRTVTVTTAGGTSGPQTFQIRPPLPGSRVFSYTGAPESFGVPAGVSSVLIEAVGAPGGRGRSAGDGGLPGRTVARLSVTPGRVLTVRVGGTGQLGVPGSNAVGGFNGGGPSTGDGAGGGGGATSVRDGDFPLVIAGGGGGGGNGSAGGGGRGGAGGGLTGGDGATTVVGGQPGGGGRQAVGGAGGAAQAASATATPGTAGLPGSGGTGGSNQPGLLGGGGGGGGYFGGGGGGGGTPGTGGGGGGSSFTAPGATEVLHQQGTTFGTYASIAWTA